MSPSRASLRILAWMAAGLLGACGGGAPVEPPASALLVTIDTLRADAVSAYGGRPGLTPHLDALAAEGLLFEHAYATVPLTLPSHSSMLTGLTPLRHTVRDNGYEVLPEAAETLAERARAAGIETAAFVSASVLHPDFGLGQGFDVYESPADAGVRTTSEFPSLRADQRVGDALRWLEQREGSRPFFLWVHLWDVHKPWRPAPRFQSRAPGEPYLQEVASADDALGRLLDGLRDQGLLDATTVVVASDHGEGLGEHGEAEHGVFCYDATMRVPLIVRPADALAEGRRGRRVDETASVVDVAPTLARGLGLPAREGLDGFDLHEALPAGRGAYLESYYAYRAFGWSPISGWVDRAGKTLHSSTPEFTLPREDPGELHNRIDEHAETVRLHRAASGAAAVLPALPRTAAELDDARRADLQALGYAAGGDDGLALPHPLESTGRPAPSRRQTLLERMDAAYALLAGQRYGEAAEAYESILRVDPDNLWCAELYATALLPLGRAREAIAPLERVVAGGRGTAITWGNLGHARNGAGQPAEAMAAFRRALDLNPEREGALRTLVQLATAAGTPEVAAPYVQRFEERRRAAR